MSDETVRSFRREFHARYASRFYAGWLHFAGTVTITVTILAVSISRLHDIQALEWLTLPVAFLYANLVEYFGHRYPMHHPMRPLRLVYRRHTKEHHRFFTNAAMAFDDSGDFKAVLFPLVLISFYFVGIGVPSYLLVAWLFNANVAWLFIAVAVGYFFNYEMLHFAYHTKPDSWIAKVPGMARLRRLHTQHHDPHLMQHYNFNITYPIGDWLFGTLYRESPDGSAPRLRRF